MRFTLLYILSFILSFSQAFAGLPPTTIKGQSTSTQAPTTFNLQVPNSQSTRLGGTTALIETGNNNNNPDPGFETGTTTNWFNFVGRSTLTNISNGTFGKRALQVASGSGVYANDQIAYNDLPSFGKEWNGLNIQGSAYVNIPYDGYSICIYRYSNVPALESSSCSSITNRTGWQQVFAYVGGQDATDKYFVAILKNGTIAGGNTETILVDEVYIGPSTNISQGTAPNTFTAKIASGGTITDITPGGSSWISSCVKSSTNNFVGTCTLTGFTSTPNCTFTPDGGGAVNANGVTASSFSYRTYDLAGAAASSGISVSCTKTGSDFVQNAITPNIADFVNEFTAQVSSAGVVSSENQDFINGNAVVTDTSLYTFTWVSNKFPVAPNCTALSYGSGPTTSDVVEIETLSSTTGIALRNMAGGTKTAIGFTIHCSRAGTDYRPQIPVPQLLGSVTSNATGAYRIETARIAGASSGGCNSNATSGSTFVCRTSTTGWISPSWISTGIYTVTFPVGTWSAPPACTCSAISYGTTGKMACASSENTTTTGTNIYTAEGSTSFNTAIDIICMGPR